MKWRILILLLMVNFSCEREDSVAEKSIVLCEVKDPTNNLIWLRTLINDIKSDPKFVDVTITAWHYQGQTIIAIYDAISSCAYCDLRSCSGQKFTPEDFNDFLINKKNGIKVWCQNLDICSD